MGYDIDGEQKCAKKTAVSRRQLTAARDLRLE